MSARISAWRGHLSWVHDGAIYNTRGHQWWPLLRHVFEGHSGLMYNYYLWIMYGFVLPFAFVLSADARCFGIAKVCLMCSVLLPSSVFFFGPGLFCLVLFWYILFCFLVFQNHGPFTWCLFLLPVCFRLFSSHHVWASQTWPSRSCTLVLCFPVSPFSEILPQAQICKTHKARIFNFLNWRVVK